MDRVASPQVTPFEVAFIPPSYTPTTAFVINRTLDAIFTLDMLVQFFVAFQYGDRDESAGKWANTLGETVRHYAKGWLIIDFFSLAP